MTVNIKTKYTTATLSSATEYTATTLTPGGNRPFWGSRGAWATTDDDCATSGTINDGENSSFSTTVTCKRQVTFQWRVSSEANSDYLEVYVNGIRKERISGNTAWATRTIDLDLNRSNSVEWRYVKDGSGSDGLDRGFVDNISFVEATTISPGSITGNQEICSGGNPTLLNSATAARSYGTTVNYQWQFSNNNASWTNIGGATDASYDPLAGLTQTRYYRRVARDECGFNDFSNTVTVIVNPLPNGNLTGGGVTCPGDPTNIVFNATSGTGPFNIVIEGTSFSSINSGSMIPFNPAVTTTYSLAAIVDNKGCERTSGLGSPTTVTVNTLSTAPNISPVSDPVEPEATVVLTASGGTEGTGSTIVWYTGPNGTGSNLGNGPSITVAPSETTTYYARREGTCNTSADAIETIIVDPTLGLRIYLDNLDNAYRTIEEAINNAVDGQTLYISPGDYPESVQLMGKALTIRIGVPETNELD